MNPRKDDYMRGYNDGFKDGRAHKAPEPKRYCQCKSLTNPCIVCGLPKFIDPEWLKRKIAEDGDEGEIGAGFELFPLSAASKATA